MARRWKKLKWKVPMKSEVRTWWEDLHFTSPATPSSRRTSPPGRGLFKPGLLKIAESLPRHQARQQRLGLRRKQVCSPRFVATPATHVSSPSCFESSVCKALVISSCLPAGCKALGPISHQLIITATAQIIFSARSDVLGSKCYSEFFKIVSFPFVHTEDKMFTWPVFSLKHVTCLYLGLCFQGTNFFLLSFNYLFHPLSLVYFSELVISCLICP